MGAINFSLQTITSGSMFRPGEMAALLSVSYPALAAGLGVQATIEGEEQ